MGCTSSAPNMDGHPCVSDNSNMEIDITPKNMADERDINIENGFKQTQTVLPLCDNLENNLQLASENSLKNGLATPEDIQTETVKKCVNQEQLNIPDSPNKISNIIHENENVFNNDNQCDENFSTLREVVEHVIIDHTLESFNRIAVEEAKDTDIFSDLNPPEEEKNKDIADSIKDITDSNKNSEMLQNEEENIRETKDDEDMPTEEATSPSQSECSRATRWEALADIAAELPPSLAVDPLTGQIYALANK